MSRSLRRVAALVALFGLLCLSALGGVTALHVLLEHRGHQDTLTHVHGVDTQATSDHAHPHAQGAASAHSHPGAGDLGPADSPGHDHVLVLTADLQPRSGRLGTELLAHGLADATPGAAFVMGPSPLWQPSRAGPAARAAPLARRSVVLQV